MNDLEEARRLMALVASQATTVGMVDPMLVVSMAHVWAHIALAEAARAQAEQLRRIADVMENFTK